jgi:hypothetical protein
VKWLNIVGLVCDFVGAIIITLGVIPSRRHRRYDHGRILAQSGR